MWEQELADIEKYYQDLLIIQYRNKPNARAMIKLAVDCYLADGIIFDLQDVLNIDTAVGAQLDLIGKILGCSRNITGLTVDKPFFSFEKEPLYIDTVADLTALGNYDTSGVQEGDIIKVEEDSNHDDKTTFYEWKSGAWTYLDKNNQISYGFSDKNGLSEGYWKNFNNSTGSQYALPPDTYRQLLKFKALYNLRRGSWGEMDEMYYKAFGTELEMINNKDLSVTYNVSSNLSLALQAAISLGYIQPPLGIDYTINYI